MRLSRRELPAARLFRGTERARLITGIVMLAVLAMLYSRMRDPDTWRWLTPNPTVVPQQPVQSPPAATGPTDEDPDQAKAASEEFQAVTDGTRQLQPEEQEVYDRLVEWVKHQSFAALRRRARHNLWYTDLYDVPDKHRGVLVALDLDVRRAQFVGENRYGVRLHEVWGLTDESRGRLYDVIVVDYPNGMPLGYDINAKAEFAGYFMKLQGYEPAAAKPGAPHEKAPLLIGRLQWEPTAVPSTDNTLEWTIGLSLLAAIVALITLRWAYRKCFSPTAAPRSAIPGPAETEVISVETWLEQAGFTADDERQPAHGGDDELDQQVRTNR
jgi:hypothetical protein